MKDKARPELKLVRDVKDNRIIVKYISSKRRTKEIVALLLNEAGHLVAQKRLGQCHRYSQGAILELPDPYG